MIKKILLLAVATLAFNSINYAQADRDNHKDNLLFLLRKTEHIEQAIKTIDQLYSNSQSNISTGKVVIIVCGEAVTSLSTDRAKKWVNNIQRFPDVKILACGLSLRKFKVNTDSLVTGVDYTENGFIKAFELQKQGYLSVEL